MTDSSAEQACPAAQPPDPALQQLRRAQALLYLVADQKDYLAAIGGERRSCSRPCRPFFGCGTPNWESTPASSDCARRPDIETAKALLQEAGYKGAPVVLLDPPTTPIARARRW